MLRLIVRWPVRIAVLGTVLMWIGSAKAADPDPKVLAYHLPKDIKWVDNGNGSETAVLTGDPTKAGLYVVLNKWKPHSMSRPHFHANDRFVTVISGTWWVGTGSKYLPDTTMPLPPGSFVTHFAKQIHWDGAKDGEVILQIVGMGPATSIPAETK